MSVGFAAEGDSSSSAPPGGEDTLVSNGLGSPLCHAAAGLPASTRRSCETADFIGTPDPTGDYALDVNINTGVSEWGNDVAATTQNVVGFAWLAFVSIVHGLVVMFEWCYSLDLLDGPLLVQVTRALHNSRAAFTEPLLVVVLAVASVFATYHGLLRRRVGQTLAQALVTFAMMAGGLLIIANPAGTVGVFERWSDQAALGTLAAVAGGTPNHPERILATSMQGLFGGVVGASWCYLEFGDVGWCRDDGSLDGRLRTAALAIARGEQSQSGCGSACSPDVGAKDRTLVTSATLLRTAQTNGELFLALPANEVQRNSVTTSGTLLNVLCGRGESADKCSGPTAAQAEFRTERGTQPRVIGICLIWIGGLGMLLLFGYIGLRLLTAALFTLLYLLLAPMIVLAPALGDGGRSAFRTWATHLLGAVVSKLLYSFLLGVALLMTNALLSLTALGWLAQWLLISAFWWGTFLKRHHTIGLIDGTTRAARWTPRDSLARRTRETVAIPRMVFAATRKSRVPRTDPTRRPPRPNGTSQLHDVGPWPRSEADHAAPTIMHDGPRDGDHTHGGDHTLVYSQSDSPARDVPAPPPQSPVVAGVEEGRKSPVLDDVREYLAGRKSYLGVEPPQ